MAKKKRRPNETNAAQATNRRRRKRRRRGRYTLYYLLVAFFAIAIGIALSLTVFFNIEFIVVEGNTKYQDSAVITASGLKTGDNLFRIKEDKIRDTLLNTYPYIEQVEVRRQLPATAILEIDEAVPMGMFLQSGGGYVLVSSTGRVLEVSSGSAPSGYMQVSGVDIVDVIPCEYMDGDYSEPFLMFRYLYEAVRETGFDNITYIDLSDRLNIHLIYEDRILIELGSESDLVDKLDFARYAIDNSIESNFEGVMDVTIAGQVRYRKQEIHEGSSHVDGLGDEEELEEEELQAVSGSGSSSSGATQPASSSSAATSSSEAPSSSPEPDPEPEPEPEEDEDEIITLPPGDEPKAEEATS